MCTHCTVLIYIVNDCKGILSLVHIHLLHGELIRQVGPIVSDKRLHARPIVSDKPFILSLLRLLHGILKTLNLVTKENISLNLQLQNNIKNRR